MSRSQIEIMIGAHARCVKCNAPMSAGCDCHDCKRCGKRQSACSCPPLDPVALRCELCPATLVVERASIVDPNTDEPVEIDGNEITCRCPDHREASTT